MSKILQKDVVENITALQCKNDFLEILSWQLKYFEWDWRRVTVYI